MVSFNVAKRFIVFLASVENKGELSEMLGFLEMALLIMHLGVPITGQSVQHQDCRMLINSLQGILMRWTNKHLSYM